MRFSPLFPLLLMPGLALAYNYELRDLPYSDVSRDDLPSAIAIGVLTDEGIVEGYADNTFRPDTAINRAEFTKIAMGIRLRNQSPGDTTICFPDVHMLAWYAPYVCAAKAMGIIEGNRREGFPPEAWPFEPARTVNYAESLKILFGAFELNVERDESRPWYEPYIAHAEETRLALPDFTEPGHEMTRGEMVQLFVRFLAYQEDEIDALLAAQQVKDSSSSSGAVEGGEEDSSSSSLSSSSGAAVSSSSESAILYDTNSDTSVRADFLLLGQLSPVLAAITVFSEAQPFDITNFIIRLRDPVTSVDSFFVYDDQRRYLGRASLVSGSTREYSLLLASGTVTLPKQEESGFYVRALLKPYSGGGISGEVVKVDRVGVEGIGVWNSKDQSQYSMEDFPMFQTARAVISTIENPGKEEDFLIAGNQMRLGSFSISGVSMEHDSAAELAVTQMTFQIDRTTSLTLDNVYLSADGTSNKMPCSHDGSDTITCADIDAEYGSFEDRQRIITLYGDISLAPPTDAHLRLRLSEGGSATSAGSVRWTDGTTTFIWVPGGSPMASSTLFR